MDIVCPPNPETHPTTPDVALKSSAWFAPELNGGYKS